MKSLNFIPAMFLLLYLPSCTERKNEKLTDLDAIRAKSSYKEKAEKIKIIDSFHVELNNYNSDSVRLSVERLRADSSKSILDQFIFEQAKRFEVTDSSGHQYMHRYWTFKSDTNLVKNVFYNWFDQQFCQRNELVKIYSNVSMYKENLVFVCTNQSIHVISSKEKIDLMKWIRYVRFTEKNVEFVYICQQAKNKKATWYTFKHQKLSPISAL